MPIEKTITEIIKRLRALPTEWDGKEAILELKKHDYQWRQMEWMGFYFEFKALELLKDLCDIPGDRIGRVEFDLKKEINFDLKSRSVDINDRNNSKNFGVILNDITAMDTVMERHGKHGEIIAVCDVILNDADGSFKKWHSELKGGKSAYELKNIANNAPSRRRKTHATLSKIFIVVLESSDYREKLEVVPQGKNSNGNPREPKYGIDLRKIDKFNFRQVDF